MHNHHTFATISLGFVLWMVLPATSWIPNKGHHLLKGPRCSSSLTEACGVSLRQQCLHASVQASTETELDITASSGVSDTELGAVLRAVQCACHEQGFTTCSSKPRFSTRAPCVPQSIPGATGRVLLLQTTLEESYVWDLKCAIAGQMDQLLYSESPTLKQPVLVSIRNNFVREITRENFPEVLATIIEEEVHEYGMTSPLAEGKAPSGPIAAPTFHVEIDGGHVEYSVNSTAIWDTSTLLVFDGLLSDDLRARLLNVILDKTDTDQTPWDDAREGPDPRRWVRGGLLDMPASHKSDSSTPSEDISPCWGLRDEAVDDLCFQSHKAIQEFESMLSRMFPNFLLCRLPEAVFGSSVSPLTANAPTCGDHFNYHIDGDPNLAPPSPWTDVFGRYPNRMNGKPRFISCLVYLNDEWDGEMWGAPTRFLDTPTNAHYDVLPKPGRFVIMDQDISHTVVAPSAKARKRPRYSLVWKLVFHPKTMNQDMDIRVGSTRSSSWPEILCFGSAQLEKNDGGNLHVLEHPFHIVS